MTSKQLIWPDLCFGKTVLASVHRMDRGRRRKKKARGPLGSCCRKWQPRKRTLCTPGRHCRGRNGRLGVGAVRREVAIGDESHFSGLGNGSVCVLGFPTPG